MPKNPQYQKVYGIILLRRPLKEADVLLTVFTKEQGKIRVLARGARKGNSKLNNKLQQLFNVELYLAGSSIWPTVTSVKVIDKYAKLRSNLEPLSLGFYATELVYKLTPDADPNTRIYELLENFLALVDKKYKRIDIDPEQKKWPPLLEKFKLELLRVLGHGISSRFCAHCGVKVKASEKFDFSSFAGGILHPDCSSHYPDTYSISQNTAGQLAILDQQSLEDVIDLTVGHEVHKCISNFIEFILERNVRSEKFLEHVHEQVTEEE